MDEAALLAVDVAVDHLEAFWAKILGEHFGLDSE